MGTGKSNCKGNRRSRSLSTMPHELGKSGSSLETRRLQRPAKMNLADITVDAKRELLTESSIISMSTVATATSTMIHEEIQEYARRGFHKVQSKPSLYEDIGMDTNLEDDCKKAAKWRKSRALKLVGSFLGGTVVIALAPVIVLLSACGGVALLSQPFEKRCVRKTSNDISQTDSESESVTSSSMEC